MPHSRSPHLAALSRLAPVFGAVALLLAGCGSPTSPVEKETPGPKRWTSFPVKLYVSHEIHTTPDLRAGVEQAAQFWNSRAEKEVFVMAGVDPTPDSTPWEEVPVNLLRFATEWPWPTQEKGRTMIASQDGTITRAVVAFQRDNNWCHSDCGFPGSVRFMTLAAHELGHVLGISHTSDRKNLMHPVVRQDRTLDEMEIDLSELRTYTR